MHQHGLGGNDGTVFCARTVVGDRGDLPKRDRHRFCSAPGSTLHVDLLDASGMPVPDHIVLLEDLPPLSPLQFPWPVQTNAEGRVTFERLAAGRIP